MKDAIKISNEPYRVLLLLSSILVAGCSQSENDDTVVLVPAGGTVVLDGVPLANANVQFLVPEGEGGRSSFAATDELGMFILKNARGREGAEPGRYKVVISKFAREDGSPFPDGTDGADFAAEGVEHLPPIYSSPRRTTLDAEVPASGKTDFQFMLTAK